MFNRCSTKSAIFFVCYLLLVSCQSTPPSIKLQAETKDYVNVYNNTGPFLGLDYRLYSSINNAFPEKSEKRYWSLLNDPDSKDGKKLKLIEFRQIFKNVSLRHCQYKHPNFRQQVSVIFQASSRGKQLGLPEIYDIDPTHPYLFIGGPTSRCPTTLAKAKTLVEKRFSLSEIKKMDRFLSPQQESVIMQDIAYARSNNDDRSILRNNRFRLSLQGTDLTRLCRSSLKVLLKAKSRLDFTKYKNELNRLLSKLPNAMMHLCQNHVVKTIDIDGSTTQDSFVRVFEAQMTKSQNWSIQKNFEWSSIKNNNPFSCYIKKPVGSLLNQSAVWEVQNKFGVKFEFGYETRRNIDQSRIKDRKKVQLIRIDKICKDGPLLGILKENDFILAKLEFWDYENSKSVSIDAESNIESLSNTFSRVLSDRKIIAAKGNYSLFHAIQGRRDDDFNTTAKKITIVVNKELEQKLVEKKLNKFNLELERVKKHIDLIEKVNASNKHNTAKTNQPKYETQDEPQNLRIHLAKLKPFGGIDVDVESYRQTTFVSNDVKYTLDDIVKMMNILRMERNDFGYRHNEALNFFFSTDDGSLFLAFIHSPIRKLDDLIPERFVLTKITTAQQKVLKEVGPARSIFTTLPRNRYFKDNIADNFYVRLDAFDDMFARIVPATNNAIQPMWSTSEEMNVESKPLYKLMDEYFSNASYYEKLAKIDKQTFNDLVKMPSLTKPTKDMGIEPFRPTRLFLSNFDYQTEYKQWATETVIREIANIKGKIYKDVSFWDGYSDEFYNMRKVFEGRFGISHDWNSGAVTNLITAYYSEKYRRCPTHFKEQPVKYTLESFFETTDTQGYSNTSLTDSKNFYVPQEFFPEFEDYREGLSQSIQPIDVLSTVLQLAQGNMSSMRAAQNEINEYIKMENDARRFIDKEACSSTSLKQYEKHLWLIFSGDKI